MCTRNNFTCKFCHRGTSSGGLEPRAPVLGPNLISDRVAQGAQYGSIKEYRLSYIGIHNMFFLIFPSQAVLGSLGVLYETP